MNRAPQPELLDELPAHDPRAVQSRKDLRRINALMGNATFLKRFAMESVRAQEWRRIRLAEIGGGDGNIAARVAHHLAAHRIEGALLLVDRQVIPPAPALANLEDRGWRVSVVEADVFDWLRKEETADIIIANLFLHHFEEGPLRTMFASVARATRVFAAVEPRRNRLALAAAGSLRLIGCNEVTRHDAAISVRAGFQGRELSALWPAAPGWKLAEARAGLFGHFFGARLEG